MLRRASRLWTFGVAAFAFATPVVALVIAACSQPPETNYGNPAGLRRDNIPGEGGIEALVCTGIPGFDAGGGGGGGGGDGGNCATSWSKDIFPNVKGDGPWKCADAKCHGGPAAPPINAATPAAAYTSLATYMIKGSPHPYINTDAGGDPTKSTIECNLLSQCGQGMPQSPGRVPTQAEMCTIDAWLRCGAPNN